jgi:hypothetical protein
MSENARKETIQKELISAPTATATPTLLPRRPVIVGSSNIPTINNYQEQHYE